MFALSGLGGENDVLRVKRGDGRKTFEKHCAGELFKPSKDWASLLVWVFGCFVSDVIGGVVLGLFGPLHLALGPNRYMVVFHSHFNWKLG